MKNTLLDLVPIAHMPLTVSERVLSANVKRLKIVPLDAAQAPRSLEAADIAAIQGNFAVASDLKLIESLKLEDMTLPYVNVVACGGVGRTRSRFDRINPAPRSPWRSPTS
ncbi:MAG: hypothetical protein H7Y61_13895 [Rhizobiales bacterium]|nr:hypothetical protein [Rhizobacter sp.]